MIKYNLAQINIAKMRGVDIDDPIMKEFVDNLDHINSVAERSEGFIWRLIDENNNATSLNPYNDEQIIINISVWESIKALENFVYKSLHTEFLRRRKEWFQKFGKASATMWWIPQGQFPTVEESVAKLAYYQQQGPSQLAFDFRNMYPSPQ